MDVSTIWIYIETGDLITRFVLTKSFSAIILMYIFLISVLASKIKIHVQHFSHVEVQNIDEVCGIFFYYYASVSRSNFEVGVFKFYTLTFKFEILP